VYSGGSAGNPLDHGIMVKVLPFKKITSDIAQDKKPTILNILLKKVKTNKLSVECTSLVLDLYDAGEFQYFRS